MTMLAEIGHKIAMTEPVLVRWGATEIEIQYRYL